MIQAVIFDCDGVLVDSETYSCGAWLPVLARRGVSTDLDEIETFIGRSDAALLHHFAAQGAPDWNPEEILAEREAAYFSAAAGNLQPFPGLAAQLEDLRRGGFELAVASSGTPRKIAFNLEEAGFPAFFPVVCSAVEVQAGKPAPDLFLLAAERLGVKPSACCVIEDSVPGLQGAVAAGMRALGFTSSHPANVLVDAGAHGVFSTFDELGPLIGKNSRD